MFKKILVPVDPDEAGLGLPAIEHAAMIAKHDDAELRLVGVVHEVPSSIDKYIGSYVPKDYKTHFLIEAKSNLAGLVEKSGLPKDKASITIRAGGAYQEVLEEAEHWGADLIVMSSHAPAMKTYLLGSTAAKIVRHAECSVTVLRAH